MDSPIGVLILTHNYPRFDGDYSGVFLHVLAKSLLPHNIQPVILTPHDAGIPEREERDGIQIIRFRYDTDDRETLAYRGNMHQIALGSFSGLLRFNRFLNQFERSAGSILRSEQIDLVWGHWLVPAGVVMKRLADQKSLPLLVSSHGTDIRLLSKYKFAARLYFSSLVRRVTAWTIVSNFLKDQIATIEPSFGTKLKVLPLPHDESIFAPDPAIQRNQSKVTAITRFTDQKRPWVLIEAFAQVRKSCPDATLEIWGSGPLQTQIESHVQQLGLAGAVAIHPPVSQRELADIYRRAGIVVLNSVDEGFGLALSEAMLCGTPVVGVSSGGITDIITHNETGLLAEPDNPGDLADKISLLLRDNALRTRLSAAGQKSAYDRYASGPLSAQYAALIRDAIAESGSRRQS